MAKDAEAHAEEDKAKKVIAGSPQLVGRCYFHRTKPVHRAKT